MISTTLKPTAKFIASAVARANDNDLRQRKKKNEKKEKFTRNDHLSSAIFFAVHTCKQL